MKKYILLILVLTGIVFSASIDRRSQFENQGTPVFRVEVPQITIASGSTSEATASVFSLNGTLRQIIVTASDATNSITFTVAIRDSNSRTLWTEPEIAENADTMFVVRAASGAVVPLNVLVAGQLTVGVTPSGVPGPNPGIIDIALYGE